jgi:pimeloyl-ACP methyl ester carboxylesterase
MPVQATPSRTSSRSSLLVELARAQAEFVSFTVALPRLRRAPRGDGHPVLVLPGLLAGDDSTRPLRWFLRDHGYDSHGWRLGVNQGPTQETATALLARLRAIAAPGRRVSLIGWSMGGLFALELAGAVPDSVRQVITLGSPLAAASERGRRAPVPVSALARCRGSARPRAREHRNPSKPSRTGPQPRRPADHCRPPSAGRTRLGSLRHDGLTIGTAQREPRNAKRSDSAIFARTAEIPANGYGQWPPQIRVNGTSVANRTQFH